ncbi:MAG: glycoside hydrolase family 6 protein [Demequinaceae bacterium]|nr:glycoside hydrolase family 6 protein [Demequinaceae bacterium]
MIARVAFVAAGLVLAGCSTVPSGSATPDAPWSPHPSVSPSSVATEWDFYLGDGGQSGVAYRDALARGDDEGARLLSRIALTPQTVWYGAWSPVDVVEGYVDDLLDAAEAQGTPAVMAVYAIPGLDCSYFGEGGLEERDYLEWVEAIARGIDGREPWVVLEPDALAQLGDCEGQGDRVGMLAEAARILDEAGARVYLDAGNSKWLSIEETASRINAVGTDHLAGFATNVSNYIATEEERAHNDGIAEITGLHYVIDTSRNGNGWDGEWCNARGRALGEAPRMVGEGYLDAFLWVKAPGESDGPCNGGPTAGAWWQEIALELASNA